jgi:hypothetical protein
MSSSRPLKMLPERWPPELASIKLTVDTYGKWLPMGNRAEVDRLDGQNGSKMVASGSKAGESTAGGN